MVSKGGVWGEGELDEGNQRYKLPGTRQINTRDVIYNMINQHCFMLYMKVVEGKYYDHKKKYFFYFSNFISI